MKKYISLCVLMIALSFGLHGGDVGYNYDLEMYEPASSQGISQPTAEQLQLQRQASMENQRRQSPTLVSEDSSLILQKAAIEDEVVTSRAKGIIKNAFQSLDDWMAKDAFLTLEVDYNGDPVIDDSPKAIRNLKTTIIESKINQAFASLEKATNGVRLKPVKDALLRAVRAFSQESTIDGKVLRPLVNIAKTTLLLPIKVVVKLGSGYGGMALGAVGGAGAGFGAGINRTAKATSKRNREILDSEVDNVMTKAVKVFTSTTIHALKGVVNTAALTAYGTMEGALLGGAAGDQVGYKIAGNWSLSKPNTVKKSVSSEDLEDFTYDDSYDSSDDFNTENVVKAKLPKAKLQPRLVVGKGNGFSSNNLYDSSDEDMFENDSSFSNKKRQVQQRPSASSRLVIEKGNEPQSLEAKIKKNKLIIGNNQFKVNRIKTNSPFYNANSKRPMLSESKVAFQKRIVNDMDQSTKRLIAENVELEAQVKAKPKSQTQPKLQAQAKPRFNRLARPARSM